MIISCRRAWKRTLEADRHASPPLSSVLAAALLFVALTSCSSAPPVTRYYLLSDPGRSAATDSTCSVDLAGATIAPYLQRTHIVLQSGSNELVPAMQHRWSEPLEAGVSRLLQRCLGGSAESAHSVRVEVEHLHGNTQGEVVLQARWLLNQPGVNRPGVDKAPPGAGQGQRFSASMLQSEAGYGALVSTQRLLVLQLCENIKSAVPDCQPTAR